jgi:hypothetical protein
MKTTALIVVILILAVSAVGLADTPQGKTAPDSLIEQLLPFKPLLGKTWKGNIQEPGSQSTMIDVSHWERALNGRAIRVLHSINNGELGGETIIVWDPQKKGLVFFSFTTAGFFTQGTITAENNQFIGHEYVTGDQSGITEVKAIGDILPGGKLRSTAKYFKNGQWVDGHVIDYVEAPGAKVIFK